MGYSAHNAATQLATSAKRRDHITPVLSQLQLVGERGRQNLRSASDRTCLVPRIHNTFVDMSFSVAGPRVRYCGTVCLQTYD